MDGPLAIARYFAGRACGYEKDEDIKADLEACTLDLGFDYFALLHHADLKNIDGSLIHIDNYPTVWSE